MKYTIALLIIIHAGFAFSQNCKFEKDEVDKFTNKVMKMTVSKPVGTYNLSKLKASAIRSGDTYSLVLFFSTNVMRGCVSKKDSYVSFKFSDDQVLTLKHYGDVGCGDIKMLAVNITDHRELLKSKDIVLIRYAIESSIDLELKDPKIISNIIHCID